MEGVSKSYRAGEVIFHEGEKGGSFLIIESGSVEVYQESSASGRIPLVCLGPGEVLGLLTFYDERPRMASARARTDTSGKLIIKEGKSSPKIPSWVNIVLREYALRLGQVNTLYAHSVDHNRSLSQQIVDTVFISSQAAAIMSHLASSEAFDLDDGRSVFPWGQMVEKVQEILGYKTEQMAFIFDVFTQQGMIKVEREPDHNKEIVEVAAAKKLAWFATFARMSRSGKVKKMVENKLPYKERRALIGLREYAQKIGLKISETVYVPFESLVNDFEEKVGAPLHEEAIENGIRMGLLEKFKKDGKLSLVYHPMNLVRTIISLNVIHHLKKAPELEE